MPKVGKLTTESILVIEGARLTFGETFTKVLNNFIETPAKAFSLLETVILSCVMIEAIVKEELKKVNPTLILQKLDAEAIAMVSGKSSQLIITPTDEISDIRTASITELLQRLAKFNDITHYHSGLLDFFNLRNKIVHSAQNVSLREHDITLILTKFVFPFIKEHVSVTRDIWNDIEKITTVAQSKFSANLVRHILKYRHKAQKLTPKQIEEELRFVLSLNREEILYKDNLVCPACHHEKMSYIIGADVDTSDGEITAHSYQFANCGVCDIHLDEIDLSEIFDEPEKYFSPSKEQLKAWREALSQPDYSEYI